MSTLLRLFCLFLIVSSVVAQIKKMRVIWLNNGGDIMGKYEDWITLKISTPNVEGTIQCGEGRGYIYTPGSTRRFTSLWFPVESFFQLTLVQYNIFTKDDATKLNGNVSNQTSIGYYNAQLSLSQFSSGFTIAIYYMGLDINITVDNYTKNADYYILMEYVDEIVANNTYGLEQSCRLVQSFEAIMSVAHLLLLIVLMI